MVVLDTMTVNTNDFRLGNSADLEVRSSFSSRTGEFKKDYLIAQRSDGAEIHGNNAILRGEVSKFVHAQFWNGNLKLTFSPASIKSNGVHNLFTTDLNDFQTSCKIVMGLLKESDVDVDIDKCNLSRIDIARDRETNHPFQSYVPVFHSLHFFRQNNNDFPTGYCSGNKQHMMCCYDKLEACRVKKMPLPDMYKNSRNLLRCEYRLLTRKKIQQALSINTIGDLTKSFDCLEDIYNRNIKDVFRYTRTSEGLQNMPDSDNCEISKLRELKEQYGKNFLNHYFMLSSIKIITEKYGGVDEFLNMLGAESLISRQNIHKLKTKITDNMQFYGRLKPDSEQGLYVELMDKFLQAA
jgi:hypothetical protein